MKSLLLTIILFTSVSTFAQDTFKIFESKVVRGDKLYLDHIYLNETEKKYERNEHGGYYEGCDDFYVITERGVYTYNLLLKVYEFHCDYSVITKWTKGEGNEYHEGDSMTFESRNKKKYDSNLSGYVEVEHHTKHDMKKRVEFKHKDKSSLEL
ncbi:hypothetical protein [Flammeovirga sp. SJP92]|uniref:hypothetical protein n=1 Tax=Flammeovirga sp. SJP92 TaxID=1775430 RepID=UPI000787C763|nr:hypothetical protein [Flammeovirga sp. SJP92]KXX70894.1 hypothetical protein AVL50_11010 [Flammeovirga sp. SJP92]